MRTADKTVTIAAAAFFAAAALLAGQQDRRRLEPKTPEPGGPERVLYVTVEHDGKLIRGLTERNFRVYEEERPVPFTVEPPEKPASIALLVEYSRGSWLYLDDIARAMQGFTDHAPEGHW